MPKPKPITPIHRMNIGVPLEVYEALQSYAEYIGKPPATVAAELIKDMHPTMLAVTKAMDKAKKKDSTGREELNQLVLQEIAATAQLASTDQVDLFNNKQE